MSFREFEFSIKKTSLHFLDQNEELLQTGFWASLKEKFGWDAIPLHVKNSRTETSLLVLLKELMPGIKIGYIPMGPLLEEPSHNKEEFLIKLSEELYPCLPKDVCFLRYDLPWYRIGKGNFPVPFSENKKLKKAVMDIQPPNTFVLDIEAPEDEILARMKHKTRYNIRISIKKGVKVTEGGTDDLITWYNLYKETGQRDNITLHSLKYYKTLYRLAKEYGHEAPTVKLLLSEVEGETVAGMILAIKGKLAYYLYGASSNRKRNFMPNHALQWKAIQIAKKQGCKYYDLFGIPPETDSFHPMYGLYRFKTGFGGIFINRYGCYDVIKKPFLYKIYKIAEHMREIYFKKIKKQYIR